MKSFYIFVFLLPLLVQAQTVIVTAKLLDRAPDGSPLQEQYKYPIVELESGENASLHLGEKLRFPIWMETLELGDGVTTDKMQYDEAPIGIQLGLKVAVNGDLITYRGNAIATVAGEASVQGASFSSTEVTFLGKVVPGEMITVTLSSPNGMVEEIALRFDLSE